MNLSLAHNLIRKSDSVAPLAVEAKVEDSSINARCLVVLCDWKCVISNNLFEKFSLDGLYEKLQIFLYVFFYINIK